MSNPDPQRPADVATDDHARKSSSPLVWILLLIALIAVGWYFYNRSASGGAVDEMTAPAPTSDAMTPAPDSSVEKEPARRAAATPKPSAKAAKSSRDATLVGQPAPAYPIEAVRAREEGTVMVTAEVDAQGNAGNVEISKRSGSRILDRAATREVAGWKFKPALEAGRPVASKVQVPVEYRLDAR